MDRIDESKPKLHSLLLEFSFYPLLLSAGLAGGFWLTRVVLTHSTSYSFLIKNLILGWIPYILSLAAVSLAREQRRRPWVTSAVWVAWLAMFPNAPYIFTDLIHWRARSPMAWWFDLGLVLMFALASFFAGIVSLRMMHDLVRRSVGAASGWLFAAVVAILSGFGVYLGRFERWNSWDLLTQPHAIFAQIAGGLMNPFDHARPIGVTLMFGTMMLAGYVMFVSMTGKNDPVSEQPV